MGEVEDNLSANSGNVRHVGLIPGSGRSLGEGNGYPLRYSHRENPMDRGAWWATVHGVTTLVKHDWASEHTEENSFIALPGKGATAG